MSTSDKNLIRNAELILNNYRVYGIGFKSNSEFMDEQKVFKVLCIDGGGIKGLYSSTILARLEEKTGTAISDYFDMICGTSTGGIIALALSLKIPANDISIFYKVEGPKIFPKYKTLPLPVKIFGVGKVNLGFMKQIFWRGKFSDKPLKLALDKVFGDTKINASNNLLCIPSYSITDARPWIFKFDHKEGQLDRDGKALYRDVALATTAAPTYFPMAEISYYDKKQFVDGGVWGNNPTLVALIEALTYFVGLDKPYGKLDILSISSLSLTGGKKPGLKRDRAFINWKDELFETSLTGQSLFTDYFMTKLKESDHFPINYIRIPSPTISSEQEHLVQLDVATPEALDLITGKANDMADLYTKDAAVLNFFRKVKTYTTNQ
jgi:hypothetical protein